MGLRVGLGHPKAQFSMGRSEANFPRSLILISGFPLSSSNSIFYRNDHRFTIAIRNNDEMGKQPVRLKAVIYTLSPFQQKVMTGIWKGSPAKIHHKISENWISATLLLRPLLGTYSSSLLLEIAHNRTNHNSKHFDLHQLKKYNG